MSDAPETIWACESASGQCVISFSTPSEDYRIEYRRADLQLPEVRALVEAGDVMANALRGSYIVPGSAKAWDAALAPFYEAYEIIRALPAPTEAEVLAAAMELPQIKALLVALEELRLEAWGYDHLFETPFHAHVHDTLQDELKKLVQP